MFRTKKQIKNYLEKEMKFIVNELEYLSDNEFNDEYEKEYSVLTCRLDLLKDIYAACFEREELL